MRTYSCEFCNNQVDGDTTDWCWACFEIMSPGKVSRQRPSDPAVQVKEMTVALNGDKEARYETAESLARRRFN